jgi:hypothetical protein
MAGWIQHNVELLSEAKVRGEIMADTDVSRVAKLMVGSFTGIQVLSRIMADRTDMAERVVDLYRHVMPSIAMPAVLVRMDFTPTRGPEIYEAAMRLRGGAELVLPG